MQNLFISTKWGRLTITFGQRSMTFEETLIVAYGRWDNAGERGWMRETAKNDIFREKVFNMHKLFSKTSVLQRLIINAEKTFKDVGGTFY